MRRLVILVGSCALLCSEAAAQAPGAAAGMRQPGTGLARPSTSGIVPTTQQPTTPAAHRPAFGGLTEQPAATRPASGGLTDQPTATRPGASAFQPKVTVGEETIVSEEILPASAARGTTPAARPRMDTASRFQSDSAAVQPTLDQDATEQPSVMTNTPRSLSGTTSRQPAGLTGTRGASPRTSTPAEAASPVAEMVLAQAVEPRLKQELPGQPLQLSQVFERTSGSAQRIKAVQTYWKLVAKVAAYHAAIDDRAMLQSVNVRQMAQHDRATLAAAQTAATAAITRAELQCIATQNELIEAALLPDVEQLPVPADVPLVSEYQTHFHTLYGERAAPAGLRRLDRALPYHLKDVRAQADAVVAAQQAVQATAEAVAAGEVAVTALVEVQRMLNHERVAFMSSVFDYNATIAEYALHVAPNQSRDTLTGMLIKTRPVAAARNVAPRSAATTYEEGEILPVNAQETVMAQEPAAYEPTAADAAPELQEPPQRFAMPSSRQPMAARQPSRFQLRDEEPAEPQDESQPNEPQPAVMHEEPAQPFAPRAGGNWQPE